LGVSVTIQIADETLKPLRSLAWEILYAERRKPHLVRRAANDT
jgi:hypothetical protein